MRARKPRLSRFAPRSRRPSRRVLPYRLRRGQGMTRNRGVPTRILVVSSPPALVQTMPEVFTELHRRGAALVFSGREQKTVRIPSGLAGHQGVTEVALPSRARKAELLTLFRQLCDTARFLGPAFSDASWPRKRAAIRALRMLGHPEPDAVAARAAAIDVPEDVHAKLSVTLARIETLLPADPALEDAVARLDVDGIFLVTRCSRRGPERDVIKVARRLGIPSVMLVWSWDNLSSKAVLNEHPDRLLVWNELQAGEAVQLHGVPRERVQVVGAPNFDRFFAEVAAAQRGSSRRDGARATVLYLGSSSNVVPDEPAVFAEWLAAVRSSADPCLREARVLVRPHPGGGTRTFRCWAPPDEAVFLMEPKGKVEPAGLARVLAEADVAVGLNTSAEIEAAIAGRPVVTFRAGADAPGQEGSLHFPYLLEESGGFVIDTPDLREHVRRLAAVLSGEYDRAAIARAVERFVRPAGISRPVAPIVASTVLELAPQREVVSLQPERAARTALARARWVDTLKRICGG